MRSAALVVLVITVAAVAGAGGYYLALQRTTAMEHTQSATGNQERKILYWYDPMYPQQHFDKPGKSPFMDMQLVPKYAGEASGPGTVTINPQVVQNLGVRTAVATTGSLGKSFEAVGSVAYNERAVVQLQARSPGFVERLYARAPLDPVKKGAPLVDVLYSEWAGAQEEYLLLRRQDSSEMKTVADAARQRLLLLGMTEQDIASVEREGKPRLRFTVTSPLSGVIAELGVREGMTVAAGTLLFRIVDLSTVWVNAEVPELQAAWLKPGNAVEARVPAYPGEVFKGRVGAILPEINTATRTVRARIELANREARLKPGMFATLSFAQRGSQPTVLIPSEALIRTGQRSLVILALGEGRFRATDVQVGAEAGDQIEIRSGIRTGDKVVLSGQFLIDSEASLTGAIARLESQPVPEQDKPLFHHGQGVVTDLDRAELQVQLDHEPIASLQWPQMTMWFSVQDASLLRDLHVGHRVQFVLTGPDKDGHYVIHRLAAAPSR